METLLGFEHETQLCSGTSYQVVLIHCYYTWAVSPKTMNKMTTTFISHFAYQHY